jgi:putative sigma-54 modulation protein
MQIQVHAKNIEISRRLNDYAEKKLNRLEHYLPNIVKVDLELSQERRRQGGDRAVAQLTVRHSRGTILRAEDKTQSDTFAAIDVVIDKMYRQISRYKGKRRRRAGERFEVLEPELAAAEPPPDVGESGSADEGVGIVRRKRIEVTPMSEEEAIDQMELLGHDFFVFYNAGTGSVNVLYRRKEGDYGLIDPIFGR